MTITARTIMLAVISCVILSCSLVLICKRINHQEKEQGTKFATERDIERLKYRLEADMQYNKDKIHILELKVNSLLNDRRQLELYGTNTVGR